MQYPTIAQPQYGFAPTMPGMASGGLASLPVRRFQDGGVSTAPRYSYDPVTQRYTRITPEQQANQMGAAQKYDYAGDGGYQADPSPFSQMTPAEQAAYYAENPTMAAVTQLGQNVFGLTSLGMAQKAMDPIGVAQAQTIAQGINPTLATPFGPPGVVTVSPIAPVAPDPTVALTQMNQQQTEEENSPVDVAMDVAATVAATQDAVDAEGGQTVGVGTPSGVGTDTGAGGGGGGGEAPGPDPGTAPSIGGSMDAGGSNNTGTDAGSDGASPSYNQGGSIQNYR